MPRSSTTTTPAAARSAPRDAALRAVVISVLLIFAIDLWLPSSAVLGVLYILPVFASAWLASPRFCGVIATICALLAIVGATYGLSNGASAPPLTVAIQLACALFVILVAQQLAVLNIASEERFMRSRELVATALASIADAVVTTDRDGRVALVNSPAERMTGWNADSAAGRPLDEVLVLRDDPETATPSDPRAPRRRILLGRDGTRRTVEVTTSPIYGAPGVDFGRVLVLRDASDLVAYEDRLRKLAYRDGLTGLANRRSLEERLELELARARRSRNRLGLLFIDLDRFKAVNDTLGHRAGDALLVAVGQRLTATMRQADTVARISGDEFCVLVPDVTETESVVQVCNKVLDALVRPIVLEGVATPIAPSIGAAIFPDHASGAEELLRVADLAMYRAKSAGGAGFALHDGPSRRWTPRSHASDPDAPQHGASRSEPTPNHDRGSVH